jgi:signal transduction histidine kinase
MLEIKDCSDHLIEIKVVDTGIGIHENNFKRIFNYFEGNLLKNLDLSQRTGGLGLTISNKLCRFLTSDRRQSI